MSTAAVKSRGQRNVIWPVVTEFTMSSKVFKMAVSVECPFLLANWFRGCLVVVDLLQGGRPVVYSQSSPAAWKGREDLRLGDN